MYQLAEYFTTRCCKLVVVDSSYIASICSGRDQSLLLTQKFGSQAAFVLTDAECSHDAILQFSQSIEVTVQGGANRSQE